MLPLQTSVSIESLSNNHGTPQLIETGLATSYDNGFQIPIHQLLHMKSSGAKIRSHRKLHQLTDQLELPFNRIAEVHRKKSWKVERKLKKTLSFHEDTTYIKNEFEENNLDERPTLFNTQHILLISNEAKVSRNLNKVTLDEVAILHLQFDLYTTEKIIPLLIHNINMRRIKSVGIIPYCRRQVFGISKHISLDIQSIKNAKRRVEDQPLIRFLKELSKLLNCANKNISFNFLRMHKTFVIPLEDVAKFLCDETGLHIRIVRDYTGETCLFDSISQSSSESKFTSNPIGGIYFNLRHLKNLLMKEKSIAAFECITRLGRGSFGTAFLYRRRNDDTLVVLKNISLHDLNVSGRKKVMNEIKIMSTLDHPNIITFYDNFEERGTMFIEMEYADNGTLYSYIRRPNENLMEDNILSKMKQLSSALIHIHAKKIWHFDIKTENIFMTKNGAVKLGDFGISKMHSTTLDATKCTLGTAPYMSPEMCRGDVVNDKSDIWSLGCVLHEMMTRQVTFSADNINAVVDKITKLDYVQPSSSYGEETRKLLKSLLELDIEKRLTALEVNEKIKEMSSKNSEELMSAIFLTSSKKVKSGIIELEWNGNEYECRNLFIFPHGAVIDNLSSTQSHNIVQTELSQLFAWGYNKHGEMAGEASDELIQSPIVLSMKYQDFRDVQCGNEFTIFLSKNGTIASSGNGSTNCLGHANTKTIHEQCLIEELLYIEIVSVAVNDDHVVAICKDGFAYTWGDNTYGQLGTGNFENKNKPQKLDLNYTFVRAIVGNGGTILISKSDEYYSCGNNINNRLAISQQNGLLHHLKTFDIYNKSNLVDGKTNELIAAKMLKSFDIQHFLICQTFSVFISVKKKKQLLYTIGYGKKTSDSVISIPQNVDVKFEFHCRGIQVNNHSIFLLMDSTTNPISVFDLDKSILLNISIFSNNFHHKLINNSNLVMDDLEFTFLSLRPHPNRIKRTTLFVSFNLCQKIMSELVTKNLNHLKIFDHHERNEFDQFQLHQSTSNNRLGRPEENLLSEKIYQPINIPENLFKEVGESVQLFITKQCESTVHHKENDEIIQSVNLSVDQSVQSSERIPGWILEESQQTDKLLEARKLSSNCASPNSSTTELEHSNSSIVFVPKKPKKKLKNSETKTIQTTKKSSESGKSNVSKPLPPIKKKNLGNGNQRKQIDCIRKPSFRNKFLPGKSIARFKQNTFNSNNSLTMEKWNKSTSGPTYDELALQNKLANEQIIHLKEQLSQHNRQISSSSIALSTGNDNEVINKSLLPDIVKHEQNDTALVRHLHSANSVKSSAETNKDGINSSKVKSTTCNFL
ncbi:hypothetical protein SNEBB_008743 [Seison nebaliae]|nr:hypothetical protein SNEBB_008743 [Seison nebaliae]